MSVRSSADVTIETEGSFCSAFLNVDFLLVLQGVLCMCLHHKLIFQGLVDSFDYLLILVTLLFCSGDSTGTENNFDFCSSSSSLGEKGTGKSTQKPLHYKSCLFHRVVKDFMIQGGDFSEGMMRVFEENFNACVIEYCQSSV